MVNASHGRLQFVFQPVKTPIHGVEALIHGVKAFVDSGETPVYVGEAFVDFVKPLRDHLQSITDNFTNDLSNHFLYADFHGCHAFFQAGTKNVKCFYKIRFGDKLAGIHGYIQLYARCLRRSNTFQSFYYII